MYLHDPCTAEIVSAASLLMENGGPVDELLAWLRRHAWATEIEV